MNTYLNRYAYPSLHIGATPAPNTGLSVVMPVHNEPEVLKALNSLANSSLPNTTTEVLIIINESEQASSPIQKQNQETFAEVNQWIRQQTKPGISYFVKHLLLPAKHAGVGLARKAGMDEAVRRFEQINRKDGIILCYDADCTCSTNYLEQVYTQFITQQLNAASIYYEHPLHLHPNTAAIIAYELHLRYYVNALRKAGYPYAFHTVGSSMAVRSTIYQKAGGMNKRKAGEDFHFLHKVIPFGKFNEITSATVYPSARVSNRVPFGTGKAMGDWHKKGLNHLLSYHPQIFKDIGQLLKIAPQLFKSTLATKLIQKLPRPIQLYLEAENFNLVLKELNRQSRTSETFMHRFYGWLNGLKMLHLVHFLRDTSYPNIPVAEAAKRLIDSTQNHPEVLLLQYRNMDKAFSAG